jgi:hypothetical protein
LEQETAGSLSPHLIMIAAIIVLVALIVLVASDQPDRADHDSQ